VKQVRDDRRATAFVADPSRVSVWLREARFQGELVEKRRGGRSKRLRRAERRDTEHERWGVEPAGQRESSTRPRGRPVRAAARFVAEPVQAGSCDVEEVARRIVARWNDGGRLSPRAGLAFRNRDEEDFLEDRRNCRPKRRVASSSTGSLPEGGETRSRRIRRAPQSFDAKKEGG